jgi:hypothetical protein
VIIGAQRSGTTVLYRYLLQHPHVRPAVRKEVQFLTLYWDRGLPWYRRHFPVLANPASRTFEASPYYLFHHDAPVRAAAALPDARFIAVLREPVSRAQSHYRHNRANGLEPSTFEQAVEAEEARLGGDRSGRSRRLYSYVSRGLYAEQIRRWRTFVGDRLLVLLTDDVRLEPQRTLDRVFAFVGLEPWPLAAPSTVSSETGEPMPEGLRRRLQERFAGPNRELSALLDRDLSSWLDGVSTDDAVPSVCVRESDPSRSFSRT